MSPLLIVINSLIEDTCVIIAVAYLLGRGPILTSLDRARASRRDTVRLGVILGLVGLSEVIFPGARYPFKMDMLTSVYSAAVGGLTAGLPCVAIVSLGSLILQPHVVALETAVLLTVSVLLTSALRQSATALGDTAGRVVLGSMTQAIAVFLEGVISLRWHIAYSPVGNIWSIPANAVGLIIFQVFVNFALERRRNEELRLAAERANAMVTEAKLVALRARIHPHFLFNALTSIAGLCRIAPVKAEKAIVNLGALMRNTLESSTSTTIPLADELNNVRVYLEIEENRLGARLCIEWEIDESSSGVAVPPFAVQTMVENAIKHGIAPKIDPSTLRVIARKAQGYTWIAVVDNGMGMDKAARMQVMAFSDDTIQHGLQLLTKQLELLHGRRSRVRVFSKPDCGTLVAFAVPTVRTQILAGGGA